MGGSPGKHGVCGVVKNVVQHVRIMMLIERFRKVSEDMLLYSLNMVIVCLKIIIQGDISLQTVVIV